MGPISRPFSEQQNVIIRSLYGLKVTPVRPWNSNNKKCVPYLDKGRDYILQQYQYPFQHKIFHRVVVKVRHIFVFDVVYQNHTIVYTVWNQTI